MIILSKKVLARCRMSFRPFVRISFFLAISVLASACQLKPELKTEVDSQTGSTIVSTRSFELIKPDRMNTPYDRMAFGNPVIRVRFFRTQPLDAAQAPSFSVEIEAEGQSPRLDLKKENSLILVANSSFSFSPVSQSANLDEKMAEYFPSFRRESARYSNLTNEDLKKWLLDEMPRIRLVGDSREEEFKISDEMKEAVSSLVQLNSSRSSDSERL